MAPIAPSESNYQSTLISRGQSSPSKVARFSRRQLLGWTLAPLVGCTGDKRLSNSAASKALEKWIGTDGKIASIQGVREIPAENAAEVEFEVQNFVYKRNTNPMEWGESYKKQRNYSGPAKAWFARFDDGTWILKKVSLPDPDVMISNQVTWNVKERIDTK